MIKRPVFLKQKNMVRVLRALAPLLAVCVYYFGWRVVAMLAVACGGGLFDGMDHGQPSRRARQHGLFRDLLALCLSLSATVPLWIVAVGAVVAILFGKEVFGGFGKNVFNPAIVGRGFVFVCFPVEITSRYVPVFRGFPGGFAHWSMESLEQLPAYLQGAGLTVADAVTAATPMWARRDFGYETPTLDLFTGRIGGMFEHEGVSRILAAGSNIEVCGIGDRAGGRLFAVDAHGQLAADNRHAAGRDGGGRAVSLCARHRGRAAARVYAGFRRVALCRGLHGDRSRFSPEEKASAMDLCRFDWSAGRVFPLSRHLYGRGGVLDSVRQHVSPTLDRWVGLWQARRKEAS
jgi:hypothetical protein